jgi:glycosyltransferase involved in cell wall biosynthesis
VRRGPAVTLIGPGDSKVPCRLISTIDHALWSSGMRGDSTTYIQVTIERAWSVSDEFDIIHSHLDTLSFSLARHCPTPVLHTLHGRLDTPGLPELLDEFNEIPLVAISASQRRWFPDNNWLATVHHGLPLESAPFGQEAGGYLAFVGRIIQEKGIADAIELARMTGLTLRAAAKVHEEDEHKLFDAVVAPAVREGVVEFEGELGRGPRDELMAGALATVMMGAWPEPFGLVAIESMGSGTPVIARRAGALPEIIDHGVTGFLVDDLSEAQLAVKEAAELDRRHIRESAVERFSVARMVDEYEAVYRQLAGGERRPGERRPDEPGSIPIEADAEVQSTR